VKVFCDEVTHQPPKLWLCNADSDLRWITRGDLPLSLKLAIEEMPWHFLFAAGSQDTMIFPKPWPQAWTQYLEELGLAPPHGLTLPANTKAGHPQGMERGLTGRERGWVFEPFAWNREAISFQQALGPFLEPRELPPDGAAVKRANARQFSLEIEQASPPSESGWDATQAQWVTGREDLAGLLAAKSWSEALFKSEYGQSGLTNRKWEAGNPLSLLQARKLLQRAKSGVVEPWHRLRREYGWLYDLDARGSISHTRGHRLITDGQGHYLGTAIGPGQSLPEPIQAGFSKMTNRVASALRLLGYFGPVGQDGYEFESEAQIHFRPLSDLNARHTMAEAAHGLAARIPDRHIAVLLFSARFHGIPADHRLRNELLSGYPFHPGSREGALWLTPAMDAGGQPAQRHSLLLSSASESGLADMEETIRSRCRS